MPNLLHKNEWVDQHEKNWKIFKEVNETFPSSFLERCWVKGSGLEFWTGIQRHPVNGTWYHLYDPLADMSDIDMKVQYDSHNCVSNSGGKPKTSGCSSGVSIVSTTGLMVRSRQSYSYPISYTYCYLDVIT